MIPAPGEVSEEGTFINKDTLLTDAVAGMFGFGASAVPNDMFNVLTHAGDLHVWKRTQNGQVDYPVSPNRNAYQEGTSGNTTIEYLGQLGNKVQMTAGSYVGTGKYGESNPNTLTFEFEPKFVVVGRTDSSDTSIGFICGRGEATTTNSAVIRLTWGGNFVSWYTTSSSAQNQLNVSGSTYNYLAIG